MCFLELCDSNYKEIQLLCQVVILLPEKKTGRNSTFRARAFAQNVEFCLFFSGSNITTHAALTAISHWYYPHWYWYRQF